jgi:PelA/Pel-15E family pectate lyase
MRFSVLRVDLAKRTWRRGAERRLALLAAAFLLLPTLMAHAAKAADYLDRPEEWFRSREGSRVMGNVLSWQTVRGSWPKNVDTTSAAVRGDPEKSQGTFDNGATTGELRLLARAFRATRKPEYEQAFLKGFDHILQAQYPNGGWPQFFPPSKQYPRHITFNDDAMVRLMKFLREVAQGPQYAFVGAQRCAAAQDAFDKGIACILKCQIVVNGRLTAWCAQHDEVNLQPRPARSYELPSISGAESAGILELLMSLKHPSPEVVRAVHAGAAWFAHAKITGVRVVRVDGNKRTVADPNAPPLWARFYDLEDGRPFFSDRDGVKKHDFNALGSERRNGYAWYGDWGIKVAERYQEWGKTIEP